MADFILEQAIYGSAASGGYQFLARSPGFRDDWRAPAEQLCTSFGDRPAGVTCPACVFARPFDREQVAVVQVADQGADDAGRPGARLSNPARAAKDVRAPRRPVRDCRAIPAAVEHARRAARARMDGRPLPPRTVEDVQAVLKTDNGPALLGGVQALLDGSRLVFERTQPDGALVRGLWTLLPDSSPGTSGPRALPSATRWGSTRSWSLAPPAIATAI